MYKKRNVNYIKPEDPEFLKALKKQAGYDDKNHKFDCLEKDFVDDGDDEQPQVVVLKKGDLTAEEAEKERKFKEKMESETKADLNQRVIFKAKSKPNKDSINKKRKHDATNSYSSTNNYKKPNTLSFADDDEET